MDNRRARLSAISPTDDCRNPLNFEFTIRTDH